MQAIITGSSKGMGYFFAKEIAARGYDVILVARSKDKLEKLATEIESDFNVKATVLNLDLTQEAAVKELITLAPKCDLLVNNAGFGLEHRAWRADLAKVQSMMKLNVETLTLLTYAFIKAFKIKQAGRIINVSSIAAYPKSFPNYAAYASGKAYVKFFTRSIRHDLEIAHSPIKIHTILPGVIKTNFFNEDTNNGEGINMTLPDKFAKVVMKRILDQNHKEVTYGKLSRIMQIVTKLLPAKWVARIFIKIFNKYHE